MQTKEINFEKISFIESPYEVTRGNWLLGGYLCTSNDTYYEVHYCEDDHYMSGLLIDDVWIQDKYKFEASKKIDIYILSDKCSQNDNFKLDIRHCYFLDCKNVYKHFVKLNVLGCKDTENVLKICKNLRSRYSNKRNQPLLTIVTTVYNNSLLLEQTLQSVINQDSAEFEYMIKDAESKDNFVEVIEKYQDYGIKVIKCKDNGIYDGMDQGLRSASGDYVEILNSDDLFFDNNIISKYIEEIKNNQSDAYCSDICIRFPNGKTMLRKADISKLRYRSCVNHTSLVMKLSDYIRLNGFDTGLKIAADCDLTIKIVKARLNIKHLNFVCVRFRAEGASNSTYTRQMLRENLICRYRYSKFNIAGYCYTLLQYLKIKVNVVVNRLTSKVQ